MPPRLVGTYHRRAGWAGGAFFAGGAGRDLFLAVVVSVVRVRGLGEPRRTLPRRRAGVKGAGRTVPDPAPRGEGPGAATGPGQAASAVARAEAITSAYRARRAPWWRAAARISSGMSPTSCPAT